MRKLIYYVYYRFSKFYEEWGEFEPYANGSIVLFGCIGFNVLTIISMILFVIDVKMPVSIIWITLASFLLLNIVFRSEVKYLALCEKYKNEKNAVLKGWLVFTYFVCSIITYGVSILLFC